MSQSNLPQQVINLDDRQKQLDANLHQQISQSASLAANAPHNPIPPRSQDIQSAVSAQIQQPIPDAAVANVSSKTPMHQPHPNLSKFKGLNIFKELIYEFATRVGLKKKTDFIETVDSQAPLELKMHRIKEMQGDSHEIILK